MRNNCVILQSYSQQTMARLARRQSGTGIYHVMLRGNNRQDIFEDEEDYRRMLSCLRGLCERYDDNGTRLPSLCTIYAYCLMSNHIHLLIQEREESIGDTIKRLGVAYARYYNKKYNRNGHLFQDRFRSEPVNDMSYFLVLLRYIHQNPIKAGLTDNLNDYPWSSWREYSRHTVNDFTLCNVGTVIKRIPFEELKEYVEAPVDDSLQILDIDNGGRFLVSDENLRCLLRDSYNIDSPSELTMFDKQQRNAILEDLCSTGAGIRQISRVTGVSFGIIQKIKKTMCNDKNRSFRTVPADPRE